MSEKIDRRKFLAGAGAGSLLLSPLGGAAAAGKSDGGNRPQYVMVFDQNKCVGCKMCMKIGCPAISMKDKKSVIDFTQCVGCAVCSQLCKFDAIKEGEAK